LRVDEKDFLMAVLLDYRVVALKVNTMEDKLVDPWVDLSAHLLVLLLVVGTADLRVDL